MSKFVIRVEGLGKRYLLGEDASRSRLADILMPWQRKQREKEFWALRDVSFNVKEGETVGIIGRNGAGKSTLLKVLSRITAPTVGRANVRGRVGTLLEVGTGFHPELTGRENVYLNGTILGLRPSEVKSRFDDIVEFAEVEKFIDTPIKRYSSGMQVRLAFAVAMYLDPEILIVDEVLAVGDMGFQRRSLARLDEAATKQGRTVLFVSHSMNSIRQFCERSIVLDGGTVVFDGPSSDAVDFYTKSMVKEIDVKEVGMKDRLSRTSGNVRFTKVGAFSENGEQSWSFSPGETVIFRFEYEVMGVVPNLAVLFQLDTDKDAASGSQFGSVTRIREVISEAPPTVGARGMIEVTLPNLILRPGDFSLYVCLMDDTGERFYDVVDTNVGLPRLFIKSRSKNRHDTYGLVSLEYKFNCTLDGYELAAAQSATQLASSSPSKG